MGRGQTNTQTHTRTCQLLDQLGPEGRVGENPPYRTLLNLLKSADTMDIYFKYIYQHLMVQTCNIYLNLYVRSLPLCERPCLSLRGLTSLYEVLPIPHFPGQDVIKKDIYIGHIKNIGTGITITFLEYYNNIHFNLVVPTLFKSFSKKHASL